MADVALRDLVVDGGQRGLNLGLLLAVGAICDPGLPQYSKTRRLEVGRSFGFRPSSPYFGVPAVWRAKGIPLETSRITAALNLAPGPARWNSLPKPPLHLDNTGGVCWGNGHAAIRSEGHGGDPSLPRR